MKDGHVNKCKICNKLDVTKHRGENLDKIRAYDRERGNRQTDEYRRDYKAKYPKKYKAHTAVNNAIRDGRLDNGTHCVQCDVTTNLVAHHDDYDQPLLIRWLCQGCHCQWHKENGEAANAS